MSALLSIVDPKEVKTVKSYFYELNQVMKSAKKSSNYIIVGGVCYSMLVHGDSEGLFNLEMVESINPSKKALIKTGIQEKLSNLNGYFIGQRLFDWYKANKSKITEFHFYKDHFIIKAEESTYTSNIITKNNLEYIESKNLKRKLLNYSKIDERSLTEDEIEQFKVAKKPFYLKIGDTTLRINYKYFLMNKPSEVIISQYKTDSEFLCIKLTFKNEFFSASLIFNVLNYKVIG